MPDPLLKDLVSVYGLSEKTIQRYSNQDGVDVWDPIAVADHVSSKQRLPKGYVGMDQSVANMEQLLGTGINAEKKPRRRPANEDILPGVSGTLQRLEEAEPSLHEEWKIAKEEGDLNREKQLHAQWTATSKTLLDYDLKLDAARKELGEMVATELVQRFCKIYGERLIWASKAGALEAWSQLRPMLKEDVHPDTVTGAFLNVPIIAIDETKTYFQEEESISSIINGFLEKLKSHVVTE